MPPEEAIKDFKERMLNYEKAYQTIGDVEEKEEISYVKVINVGRKVVAYNIQGYIASQ